MKKKTIEAVNIMKVIDVTRDSVSDATKKYLIDNCTEYRDQNLCEDLLNIISQLDSDEDKLSGVKHPKKVWDEMKALVALCNEHDAAYVRFVN